MQTFVGVSDAIDVTVGRSHACVLHRSGQVSCWGSNSLGQLGAGLGTARAAAEPVPNVAGVVAIGAGGDVRRARIG
jgi:alpha-tubulin suppressor-like RCC1 family protein